MNVDKPIISVISDQYSEDDYSVLVEDAMKQLDQDKSHLPFVHHIYVPFFEQGIPVIHLRPKRFSDGTLSYVLTTFMPKNIGFQNMIDLKHKIKEFEAGFDISREEVVYVKDKNSFGGYDYEFYPPVIEEKTTPLTDICDMFYRDANGMSSDEEKKMFSKFREFDLNSMFFDESYLSYPINHNGCGVILINQEGRVRPSPVTKNVHIETLSYLLSEEIGEDVTGKYTFPEVVSDYKMGVVLIRDGQTQMFIPSQITDEQKKGLIEVYEDLYDSSCGGDFGNSITCATLGDDNHVIDAGSRRDDILEIFNRFSSHEVEEGSNRKRV